MNKQNANKLLSQLARIERNNKDGMHINQLRVVAVLERLIARLEADSILAKCLIFKGGFALLKTLDSSRFTRDLDASFYDSDTETLGPLIEKAAYQDFGDGVFFFDIKRKQIVIGDEYPGLRFDMAFQITESRDVVKNVARLSRVHFDIALGDYVANSHFRQEMPSLLDHLAPLTWQVYAPEQIFAEKLQTAVARGEANSRSKDIYDLVQLHAKVSDRIKLTNTIEKLFSLRKTIKPKSFYEFFSNLDSLVLEQSWRAVKLANKPPFGEIWSLFLQAVDSLDG